MAGYGQYDITPVDVFKPLMLGETVRQNRMMDELKTYQINKAKREDQVATQVGTYLDAALKGDPKAESALAGLSPEWRLKVAQLKSDQEMRAVLMRLHLAQASRQEKLAAGGGGVGGAIVPSAPMATLPGMAPGPVAPTGGAPRPFGYSLPGQQGALQGADTATGADVPSPVPTETLPAAPVGAPSVGAPALPPGRFQGIGSVGALDPAIPVPEGESGAEPPAPVVPGQAPGAPPTARRGGYAAGGVPADMYEAAAAGWVRAKDEKGRLKSAEAGYLEMFPPGSRPGDAPWLIKTERVAKPDEGEKWARNPKDPRYQINARTGKEELIAVPAADKADQPSQAETGKVRTMQAEARSLIAALDQYRDLIGSAKWDERLGAVVGFGAGGARLNTAYNSAALLAKGEELFNLGVLNGPDLAIIRRTITDPSEYFKLGLKNEAIQAQVDMVKNLVATRLAEREKAVGMKPADTGTAKPLTSKPDVPRETPSGPAPGTIDGGYRFKGGDASKPANWERVP